MRGRASIRKAVLAATAAARMRAGGPVVIPRQRRAEVCPLRRRPQEEQLVQQQLAVEDVAARDARDALDVRLGGMCVELLGAPLDLSGGVELEIRPNEKGSCEVKIRAED